MFIQRFLKKYIFDNYDDYKENAIVDVPENFNFAYDVVDAIADKYPEYCFEKHKGYPTKLHYEMVEAHGLSDVHRRSFFKKYKGGVLL